MGKKEEILLEILQNDFDDRLVIEHIETIVAKLGDAGWIIVKDTLYDYDYFNF